MARTTARRSTPSGVRRTLGATGVAGLVGGMTLVGAGAIAAPHAVAATTSTTVTKTLKADCTFFGQPLGTWTVQLSAEIPTTVEAGAAFAAPKLTAKVTTSGVTATTLRNLYVLYLYNGESPATYSVFGKNQTANLTFPKTNIPATGPLTTTASGNGAAGNAPTTPGQYPVVVGDFQVNSWAHHGPDPDTGVAAPDSFLGVPCKMNGSVADRTLTTINVTSAATSTSSTTSSSSSSSSSSTSTTSSSTTSSTSTTSSSSTSEPTSTTTTSEPTETTTTTSEPTTSTTTTPEPTDTTTSPISSAPVVTPSTVQTGSVGSSSGNNMLTAAGLGLTAIGVVAVGGAVVAGRKREQR